MKSSNDNIEEIKKKFQSLFAAKIEEEEIDHDAYMLMAGYLSEIERVQKQKKIKRNMLAEMIKTSASYLTQVFRGDKPLNFQTIAKIQKALDIKFSVTAHYKNPLVEDAMDYQQHETNYFGSSYLSLNATNSSTYKAKSNELIGQQIK